MNANNLRAKVMSCKEGAFLCFAFFVICFLASFMAFMDQAVKLGGFFSFVALVAFGLWVVNHVEARTVELLADIYAGDEGTVEVTEGQAVDEGCC